MNIDHKYRIAAVNPHSGSLHDENDSILFLAKDKAVPGALLAYRDECLRLGADPAHIHSIDLLIERVDNYQREVEAKVPDTDTLRAADDERRASFEAVARPLIKWMAENCHPHTTTIVGATHAELLEGALVVSTHEYLCD